VLKSSQLDVVVIKWKFALGIHVCKLPIAVWLVASLYYIFLSSGTLLCDQFSIFNLFPCCHCCSFVCVVGKNTG